ncbi:MAG TPA: hypothetical protein PLG34_01175 [Spirochaetota bacterium]|jgi:SAM-dependent methyltransferase|nr:MAG: hypothetical protein BWX91_00755 [Spirochaetes bacterium ADurb.Bin133]HPY86579.1 hypothetical protein [Spirochaetota bacterium]HQB60747.1 hypothetical protein [Spirochaetota bacterium]
MPNLLKNIDIRSNNENRNSLSRERTIPNYEDIKPYVRDNSNILCLNSPETALIKQILAKRYKNLSMTIFEKDLSRALNLRNEFRSKNIQIINGEINEGLLKSASIDLVIGKNILGDPSRNGFLLKEIKRVLKNTGGFVFSELVYLKKPINKFYNYFRNKGDDKFSSVIFDFQRKLKKLEGREYEIKIIGDGNFYFNSRDVNSLQEFCDLLGYKSYERTNILSQIFLIVVKGKIKK